MLINYFASRQMCTPLVKEADDSTLPTNNNTPVLG